jgi:predicted house-cleaning noncanonical NTP pyrophosphatase (MazG superfamily)
MRTPKKLIRDKIPEIIKANGEAANIRVLDDKEYLKELIEKLKEEADEFMENPSVEALADIKEVTIAIRDADSRWRARRSAPQKG